MSGLNMGGSTIAKTTKLFIGGEFPRTESGRSFPAKVFGSDTVYAHLCQGSRKDLRAAVEAAQKAQSGWSGKTAYNRAQILYRMAEMLEGKRHEFQEAIRTLQGVSQEQAKTDVDQAVNHLVYYAGFADKFSQVMASVNPVSGPFHNFTTPEPVGVTALIYDAPFSLSQWMSQVAAILCSGNTLIVMFDQPGAAILSELGEVFKTSDLPGGVVNLISGQIDELYEHAGRHMEIASLAYAGDDREKIKALKELATENMKRVVVWNFDNEDLAPIVAFTEAKTVWHPVGL